MNGKVVLATTYYDPQGRLFKSIQEAIPVWQACFDQVSVSASPLAFGPTLEMFEAYEMAVEVRDEKESDGLPPLGLYRRLALDHALAQQPDYLLMCDLDRAAYWANHYPDELKQVVSQLPEHDFWVMGRTERAFLTHPPSMVRTERIINDVFAMVSGHSWDVLAAARGMTAEVARFLIKNSADDSFGVDPGWPLLVQQDGRFSMGYQAVEGMEFETAVAYADEVEAAGGVEAWLTNRDADPHQWHYRLKAATVEVAAILPFWNQNKTRRG